MTSIVEAQPREQQRGREVTRPRGHKAVWRFLLLCVMLCLIPNEQGRDKQPFAMPGTILNSVRCTKNHNIVARRFAMTQSSAAAAFNAQFYVNPIFYAEKKSFFWPR